MARAADAQGPAPRFAPGNRVRVTAWFPVHGHIRTPYYLRGKTGVVIRYFGLFFDPTELAAGINDGTVCGLYQVVFDHNDVWGAAPEIGCGTTIAADLYDNWLEAP